MRYLIGLTALAALPGLAPAYVGTSPTLAAIINDARHVVVLQVDKVSIDKRAIIFKKVADIKGTTTATEYKHQLGDGSHPCQARLILTWAQEAQELGGTALCFHDGKASLICLGDYWYECTVSEAPWWTMTYGRPELSFAYMGSTAKLRQHVADLLAGKKPIVTAVAYDYSGYGDVTFKRPLRGKDYPVWRLQINLQMTRNLFEVPGSGAVVGDGPADPKDMPALTAGLRHEQAQVRREAATDLGLMGPPAKEAIADLVKALQDADELVRVTAAAALLKIDATRKDALPVLMAGLQSKRAVVQRVTLESLGDLGPEAHAAVPALTEALQNSGNLRWLAAEALGHIGPAAAPAVPRLIEVVKSKDPELRGAAIEALGRIGPKAREAAPLLHEEFQRARGPERWLIALALGRIGGAGAADAVALFTDVLKTKEVMKDRSAYDAMFYLTALGPAGKDAVPILAKLSQTGDSMSQYMAPYALWSIEPKLGLKMWMQRGGTPLSGGGQYERGWTGSFLRAMGPHRRGAAVAVAEEVRDGRMGIAAWVVSDLLRPEAEATVPVLIDGLKSKNAAVRRSSASVLQQLGPVAKAAVPNLKEALQDENAEVRSWAAAALKAIEPKAEAKK